MTEDALFPLPPKPAHSRVLVRVRASVKAARAAGTLGDSDAGLVAMAERVAADLDACAIGAKEAAAFQAQLGSLLKELGLTPRARRLAGQGPEDEGQGVSPLDEISRIRNARRAASADPGP